jgi:hypothetical protein
MGSNPTFNRFLKNELGTFPTIESPAYRGRISFANVIRDFGKRFAKLSGPKMATALREGATPHGFAQACESV